MRLSENKFQSRVSLVLCMATFSMLSLVVIANVGAQTRTAKAITKASSEAQQPIYREYRGVRLNMTMEEARAKLGDGVLKSDELDYFVFSANEVAQIAYNAAHKVKTISIDYTGGIGAPDYMTVVGGTLQQRPDGSLYRMVEYAAEGFWVSYNKSGGTNPTVTITLQSSM